MKDEQTERFAATLEEIVKDARVESRRDPLLVEKEKTHGDFRDTARIAQGIKRKIRDEIEFQKLNDCQKEVLEIIATKIARILAGDVNEVDHWVDIAGYAKLGAEACR